MAFYRQVIRPLLFRTDAEWAHRQTMTFLEILGKNHTLKAAVSRGHRFDEPRLEQKLWGLTFTNPVGVAAGLDKYGQGVGVWEALGFGWTEVGTVTAQGQPGNPQPRLFRLPKDQAVINRMGFNNPGAVALAQTLTQRSSSIPVGINLGKSKITSLEDAAKDYLFSFQQLYTFGNYFVINVSSPNTPGLRELQKAVFLREIFAQLQQANTANKPLLVKIAPDLLPSDLEDIILLIDEFHLSGIIATNTTISRPQSLHDTYRQESGGLSGRPLTQLSNQIIDQIWQITKGTIPIVGVGGIMNAEDAWQKIIHGASLLQLYTGLVYGGSTIVKNILQGLDARCQKLGLTSISQAVGLAHNKSGVSQLRFAPDTP